jgi:hypothetical protein
MKHDKIENIGKRLSDIVNEQVVIDNLFGSQNYKRAKIDQSSPP